MSVDSITAMLSDTQVPMPEDMGMGVAIVGAGTIVRVAHLPAYRKAGFSVRGIYDTDRARADALARSFNVPRVYDELSALLNDTTVDIVDVAVPPEQQPQVARAVAAAGKHLLCQKPLAWTAIEAQEIVDAAATAGIVLAVNQQTRWAPALQASRRALTEGLLGTPTRCIFDFAFLESSSWWNNAPEPALWADCVHTVDAARFLLGEPERVVSHMWSGGSQEARGKTLVEIILDYGPTTAARISTDTIYWADTYARFELHGTEAIARASLAEWTHYPLELPDEFELVRRVDPGTRHVPKFTTSHIPDAFVATMAELMIAIERHHAPAISGLDNLRTLMVLEAASHSAATGQAVRMNIPRTAA